MKSASIVIWTVVLLPFILGIYLYPSMADRMVTHWGINGEPNGFSSKFTGLFLMPVISILMYLLFIVLPKIDPMKQNVIKFRKYYDLFITVIIGFMFYLYLLTIYWNLGFRFNIIQFLIPAFGILFYIVGVVLEKSKRNWFIGIRTPWTLTSDRVWEETNRQGARLFKISAAIIFLGVVFPIYAFYFVLIPVISVAFYLVFYSYYVYKKILPGN